MTFHLFEYHLAVANNACLTCRVRDVIFASKTLALSQQLSAVDFPSATSLTSPHPLARTELIGITEIRSSASLGDPTGEPGLRRGSTAASSLMAFFSPWCEMSSIQPMRVTDTLLFHRRRILLCVRRLRLLARRLLLRRDFLEGRLLFSLYCSEASSAENCEPDVQCPASTLHTILQRTDWLAPNPLTSGNCLACVNLFSWPTA